MGAETGLVRRILVATSSADARLFRQNVGMAWVGDIVERTRTRLVLENYRPLHAGLCEGSSDTIGLSRVLITPDMVDSRVAVFTAIEAKTAKGRVSPKQQNFIGFVQQFGGIAGVARSPDEAVQIIKAGPGIFLKG